MSSNQRSTWVVSTDSNTCRIYNYSKKANQLNLFKEMQHPENKLRDIEITSGKPGHYKASSSSRGTYEQPTDPKEIQIEKFSREIAKELDQGRNNHAYEKLVIIAPPHMNGLLQQHINKHVKDLVSHNIEKDVSHLADHELLNFLHEHTRYSDES